MCALTGEITKSSGSPEEIKSEEGEWVGKRAREEFQRMSLGELYC